MKTVSGTVQDPPSSFADGVFMHRAVIFSDIPMAAPLVLIKATLNAIACRDDIKVVAVCVPAEQVRFRAHWERLVRKVPLKINPGDLQAPARRRGTLWIRDLGHCARQHRFALISPPDGNINDPQFIDRLCREFRPTMALSYYCMQKFGEALLGIFIHAVNYHNGLLPAYRGLNATAWSVYNGEERSGFAFHRMTNRIDQGPVLLDGEIPVVPGINAIDLDHDKAAAAAIVIPRVLQMIVAGDAGRPQGGVGSYYTKRRRESLTSIGDPSALSSDELSNRLRAFEKLLLNIDGRWHKVKHLRPIEAGGAGRYPASFRTTDGVTLAPVKCRRVPFVLWWFLMWMTERMPVRGCAGSSMKSGGS